MLTPRRIKVCVLVCVAAALSLRAHVLVSAQAPPPRVLTVTVTDKQGEPLKGLTRESFTVLDGGRPSEIISFESGDMPATVGVLLDASGSFGGGKRLALVREAVRRFFKGCHPSDEFFLMAFNQHPQLVQGLTNDPAAVLAALDRYASSRPMGQTALYDTLYLALNQAERGRYTRRVVLLLTDGQDNVSTYTFKELRRQLAESDVLVYAVAISDPASGNSALDDAGRSILAELTKLSGGRAFYPETAKDLDVALESLARELRSQYAIVFAPSAEARKDGWHEVRVRLGEVRAGGNKVKVEARARAGFYDVPPPRRAGTK